LIAGADCENLKGRRMARVRIEQIVDHLSSEMRRALEAAVSEVAPDAHVDAHDLFRAFRRAVGRKCSTWETVPDQLVETE
jgi:hypothetical protein